LIGDLKLIFPKFYMKSIQLTSKPFRQQPEATITNLKVELTTVSEAARE
jgi:hypothetical protein